MLNARFFVFVMHASSPFLVARKFRTRDNNSCHFDFLVRHFKGLIRPYNSDQRFRVTPHFWTKSVK